MYRDLLNIRLIMEYDFFLNETEVKMESPCRVLTNLLIIFQENILHR